MVVAALLVNGPQEARDTSAQGLSITGLVDHKQVFAIEDLKSMPNVTVRSELICVSGKSFGTHNWTGVRLGALLEEAGVQPGVVKVAFRASGNYSTDLTIEDATRGDVIVALYEDGVALNTHTKLVVPGKWGYKWIDGIEEIELVDYDYKGTWERSGYSDSGNVSK